MPSFFRRAGAQLLKVLQSSGTPLPVAAQAFMYARAIVGSTQLFAIDSDGEEYQITPVPQVTSGLPGTPLPGLFASGVDGAFTFDGATTMTGFDGLSIVPVGGVYTLPRCLYMDTAIINNGVVINTAGFRMFGRGALTNNGTCRTNGGAGGAGLIGTTVGGLAGTAAHTGSFYCNSTSGVAGGNSGSAGLGNVALGVGVPPLGITGPAITAGQPGSMLHGGGGGNGGAGSGGGGTGSVSYTASSGNGWNDVLTAFTGRNAAAALVNGGGGGGSGSGTTAVTAGGGGGGSGAAGGIMGIFFQQVLGNGTFEARGGAGGAGGPTGNTGGGAGGSGGIINIVTQFVETSLTFNVNGGAGGASTGTGQAGGAGGVGQIRRYVLSSQ